MKTVVILFLDSYQKFISPFLKQVLGFNNSCRFYPTCSDYAKMAVREKGIFVGLYISITRILKCQPFYNPSSI